MERYMYIHVWDQKNAKLFYLSCFSKFLDVHVYTDVKSYATDPFQWTKNYRLVVLDIFNEMAEP